MTNDNAPRDGIGAKFSPSRNEPDAHGQAALLLVESLLHGLIEARFLSADQAASIIRTAAEVKVEVATMIDESEGRMEQSLALLSAIERSVTTYAKDGA